MEFNCIWIKTYMYLKVPPVGYVALVGVPILLELHVVMVGVIMAGITPSTIIIDLY